MKLKDILNLDGEKIGYDILNEIWENENVISVENNGNSGLHYGYIWYSVKTKDYCIDVYSRK